MDLRNRHALRPKLPAVAAGAAVCALVSMSAMARPAAANASVGESCAGSGDVALVNGKILTMASPAIVKEIVIRGGKVVRVGHSDRRDYTPCTRVIDLHGRTAVPGLIDAHIHLVTWGFRPGHDLRLDLASSMADVSDAVRRRAAEIPAGEWVAAVGGWSHVQLRENRLPTLAELDKAAPGNPVFFWERNGAAAVTNSRGKAFFEAHGVAVGPDGLIPAEGSRSAVAYSVLANAATDPMRGTKDALAYLAQVGLTTVSDMGVNAAPRGVRPPERSWHSGHVNVYTAYDPILALARADALPVRVRISFLDTPDGPAHDEARLKYQFPMFGNDMIATLCMGEYITPDPTKYEAVAVEVARRGWCHEQHALGAKENRNIISTWEKVTAQASIAGLHWRIAHVTNIEQSDLDRLKALGAGVNLSPLLYDAGSGSTTYNVPYRSIVDSGIPVGGVSDGPNYLPVDPFVHIAIMVTGKDNLGRRVVAADQTLTRLEALKIYTANNAWFMGDERLGTLKPGSLGDVVVLDKDYLTAPEDQIRGLKPVLTIVGEEPSTKKANLGLDANANARRVSIFNHWGNCRVMLVGEPYKGVYTMKSKYSSSLLFGASLLAIATCPAVASAQATSGGAAASPSDSEVVVTGTRIVSTGYQASQPLTVASAAQIAASASPNITQFLTTLPEFSGSLQVSSGQAGLGNGQSGANNLNLRQLGYPRTLVLLDGQRIVPSTLTGAVDIDTLPQQLIKRVDIVTGGASSVYGSDAVAGVVNFILDKKFTGLKGEVSGGETSYGDDPSYKLSLAYGTDFAGGRGHFLLSGEDNIDQGVLNGVGSRTWNRNGYQVIVNPNYTATNGQPQNLILTSVGMSTATFGGIIVSGPLQGTAFGQGGVPYKFNYGPIVSAPFMQGGDWAQNEVQDTNLISLQPRAHLGNIFTRASYDLTDNVSVYGQFQYAHADIYGKGSDIFLPGTTGPVLKADNAFIPASVRAQLTPTQTIQIGTLNYDLGSLATENTRDFYRFVLGADGHFRAFDRNWNWSASYSRGDVKNLNESFGNLNKANFALAVDAVVAPAGISGVPAGTVVCRSTLTNPTNGCVPYNVLGIGVNGPAAISYVTGSSRQNLEQTMDDFAGTLAGDLFNDWAGPVSAAFSVEHRKSTINGTADPTSLALGWFAANLTNISGEQDVTEGAAELLVPLARDLPFAKRWDLSAAIRDTDYSTSGTVQTWKLGTVFEPIDGLKLRVTRSRDIRAPTLNELYAQGTVVLGNFFDPFTNSNTTARSIVVGNPNLKPEDADTWTAGIVVQPSWLRGFSASVDYWQVSVKNSITSVLAQDLINQCYLGTQSFCNQITRTNGVITLVTGGNFNAALNTVRGVDIEASYRIRLSDVWANLPGALTLHTNMTRYLEDTTNNGLSPPTISTTLGAQPLKFVTTTTLAYDLDRWHATLTARTGSDGLYNANAIVCTTNCPTSTVQHPTINTNTLPGYAYLDASLTYDFSVYGGQNNLQAFINIRNLLNADPGEVPIASQYYEVRTNSVTTGARYDILGRLYRVGIRFKM